MPSETHELTVAPGGDVVLGPDVLGHLHALPGDKLVIELLPDGRAELRTKSKGWDAFFNSIKYDGPPVSLEEIQQTIERGWAGLL